MAGADGAARITAAVERASDALTRRAILGMRYDASFGREVIAMLDALERDLVGQIAAIDVGGVERPSARRARLAKLLTQARAAIRSVYRRVATLSARNFADLTEIEAIATANAFNSAFAAMNVSIQVSLPTASTYAALADERLIIGQPLKEWWDNASSSTVGAFAREMRIGIQAGETVEQLARRVAGGTRDGVAMRGLMDTSRSTARTLVRTSVASVQNAAREAVYEANLDVITEFVHLSRLDGRTSDVCIERAGKRWDAETRQGIGHTLAYRTPPLHPNCRSVLVVRVIGGDPPEVGDGEAWLKKQSPAEQNALLGKGKAELFRAGKITMRDLLDQSDRPVPLSALKG